MVCCQLSELNFHISNVYTRLLHPFLPLHRLSQRLSAAKDELCKAMTQLPPRTSSLLDADRLHPQSHGNALPPSLTKGSNISRPSSTAPPLRPGERAGETASDGSIISDKATAAFIRRTLCAHHALSGSAEKGRSTPRPIEELLPPLTSSNEVDLQLYAIIAVILKEFVFTWYAKITPDHVFVDEVIHIIAHCTRALEQRLRKVDLESLLLDEVPRLIDAHLTGA